MILSFILHSQWIVLLIIQGYIHCTCKFITKAHTFMIYLFHLKSLNLTDLCQLKAVLQQVCYHTGTFMVSEMKVCFDYNLFLSHNTDYNLFLSHNTISLFEYQCQYCKYCTSSSLNNQPTLKFIHQNKYRITKNLT